MIMTVASASPEFKETLRTQFRLERLQAIRDLLLNILAFDGIVVWLDVISPRQALRLGGSFAALMWPICFGLFAITRVLERRTQTQLNRLLESGNQTIR